MTNETKEIIDAMQELFVNLRNDIDDIKNRMGNVENTVTETRDGQENLAKRINGIEKTVTKIEMMVENETNKKLQLLGEGFQSVPELSEEVHSLSKDMEIVKFDVDIVKKVVTTHSTELNKLGRAK